jgi:hypothetical protein
MKSEIVPIGEVKLNPNNPRSIKKVKFDKLVRSIREFPSMLEMRPIVVDEDMVVLGGNMRLQALREAGYEEVPIIRAIGWTEEQKREFVVKDNISYGEWDWDMLANEFDPLDLDMYGMDLDPKLFQVDEDDESASKATSTKFNDYVIYFANEREMDIWYAFVRRLKDKFKDEDNISTRILRYIAEVYDENNMKESQMILKFIEQEVGDGN